MSTTQGYSFGRERTVDNNCVIVSWPKVVRCRFGGGKVDLGAGVTLDVADGLPTLANQVFVLRLSA